MAFLVFGPVIEIKMLALLRTTFTARTLAVLTHHGGSADCGSRTGGEPCDLTAGSKAGSAPDHPIVSASVITSSMC